MGISFRFRLRRFWFKLRNGRDYSQQELVALHRAGKGRFKNKKAGA